MVIIELSFMNFHANGKIHFYGKHSHSCPKAFLWDWLFPIPFKFPIFLKCHANSDSFGILSVVLYKS